MPQIDLNNCIFITLDEASELLRIDRRTLQREIRAGRFPKPLKVGRAVRIPVTDFAAYIQSLRLPTAGEPFRATAWNDPSSIDMEMLTLIHRLVTKHLPL